MMRGNSKIKDVFLSAIVMGSFLQIRPLLFSTFEDASHRVLPEANRHLAMEVAILPMPALLNAYNANEKKGLNTTVSSRSALNNSTLAAKTALFGPIFFNAFVPNNGTKEALRIVKEQMKQRKDIDPESPVQYTLIGSRKSDDYIQKQCQPNCYKRTYLEKGNEVDTLQALWEYCQNHTSEIVTYLHDKGSFHPSSSNNKARRVATKAALECRGLLVDNLSIAQNTSNTNSTINDQKIKKNKQCSICSYRFYSFPGYHSRSNMWSAACSYIQNLMPPKDYVNAVDSMISQTINHTILGPTTYACLQPPNFKVNFLGLGRYAMERWPFNHPDVFPCDALSKKDARAVRRAHKRVPVFKPKLIRAPQKRAKTFGIESMISSWERLEGRLFEWDYLYQKQPSQASWVWKFYKGYERGTKEHLEICKKQEDEFRHKMKNQNSAVN